MITISETHYTCGLYYNVYNEDKNLDAYVIFMENNFLNSKEFFLAQGRINEMFEKLCAKHIPDGCSDSARCRRLTEAFKKMLDEDPEIYDSYVTAFVCGI